MQHAGPRAARPVLAQEVVGDEAPGALRAPCRPSGTGSRTSSRTPRRVQARVRADLRIEPSRPHHRLHVPVQLHPATGAWQWRGDGDAPGRARRRTTEGDDVDVGVVGQKAWMRWLKSRGVQYSSRSGTRRA